MPSKPNSSLNYALQNYLAIIVHIISLSHTHPHLRMHVYTHIHTHMHTHAHTHAHTHTRTHTHTHTHTVHQNQSPGRSPERQSSKPRGFLHDRLHQSCLSNYGAMCCSCQSRSSQERLLNIRYMYCCICRPTVVIVVIRYVCIIHVHVCI